MGNNLAYRINSAKSSLRNNILLSFFLVLTLGGISINIIFQNAIQATLSRQGLDSIVIDNISRSFTMIGSAVTIAGIVIVLIIALFISETISRPLRKLTDGMNAIAHGKWNTRIDIASNDELGQLAEGFNFMADHIEDSLEKLKSAKEYTDNIVFSVPSILVVISNRLNILSANRAFERLNEQYPTLSLDQFIELLEYEIQENLKTGSMIKKEIEVVPDGSDVSLIFSATVSRLGTSGIQEGEEKASILLTITDITERKKMKELVLQSRQDWEDTFDTIPDMITVHDKDFNIVYANKSAKEILHLPVLDPSNINKCYKYYHGTNAAPEGCPSCDCFKTAMPATFEIFEPHLDKFIEIRSIPRINSRNKIIGLIHIVRDISFRKQVEDEHNQLLVAITKAKMEWEMTFDSASELILLIDNGLAITRCNKSFSEYMGRPIESIKGLSCYEFFQCDNAQIQNCRDRSKISCKFSTGDEIEMENGRWLHVSHRPIQDENRNITKSVIIATDITKLKNIQQKLSESEEALKKKVDDLEKFYDMAVDRELRMKELKKKIKRLNDKLDHYEKRNLINR